MSTKQTNTKNKKKQTTKDTKKATIAKETKNQKTAATKPKTVTKSKKNTKDATKTTSKKPVASKTNVKKIAEKKPKTETSKATKIDLRKKIEKKANNNELVRLIKIIVIITVIMALIYVVTMIATKKADEVKDSDTTANEKTTKTEIQYEKIMIGTMLNKGGTYYVLIEDDKKNDQRVEEYDQLVTNIKNNEGAVAIYKADLTDAFNKVYKAKEDNYYVDNVSDFKVTGTTLVKIEDSKVVSALDDYEEIKNELNNLK